MVPGYRYAVIDLTERPGWNAVAIRQTIEGAVEAVRRYNKIHPHHRVLDELTQQIVAGRPSISRL